MGPGSRGMNRLTRRKWPDRKGAAGRAGRPATAARGAVQGPVVSRTSPLCQGPDGAAEASGKDVVGIRTITLAFIICVAVGLFALNFVFDFPVANQHTYMVHALRLLGMPGLAQDWLAQTTDPAPLVTLLSALALGLGGGAGIGVLYFGCCLSFVACWFAIAVRRGRLGPLEQFLALPFLLLPFFNPFNQRFAYGVAEQYILGGYWQPSEAAGAALVIAFTLFVLGRPVLAVLAAAGAAALHPGSLLAASLVAAMVVLELAARRAWQRAARVALAYALCTLPVLVWVALVFRGGATASAAEAARILVHERIPHHTLPAEWLGRRTAHVIGLVILAILAWWRDRRVAFGLAVLLGGGILLSLAVVLIDRDAAYLLFPWRISALLVPLAWLLLSITVARAVSPVLRAGLGRWAASVPGRLTAMALILLGAATMPLSPFIRVIFPKNHARGLIAWVDAETAADAVFIVPLDFEWFRLKAGRPVLVDWKSNPFRDDEVIEWHARIAQSRRIMEAFCRTGRLPAEAAGLASLIVVDRHAGCRADPAAAAYRDADFAVFRIAPG